MHIEIYQRKCMLQTDYRNDMMFYTIYIDIYHDVEFTYKWNKFADHDHTNTIVKKCQTATSRNECI